MIVTTQNQGSKPIKQRCNSTTEEKHGSGSGTPQNKKNGTSMEAKM
jgi:hypothetical protein